MKSIKTQYFKIGVDIHQEYESTKIDTQTTRVKAVGSNKMVQVKTPVKVEVKKEVKADDITFVGKVQLVEFDNGSNLFNISLGDTDRKNLESTKTEKGWNNLVLQKSKQGTWYLSVSKFKPVKQ